MPNPYVGAPQGAVWGWDTTTGLWLPIGASPRVIDPNTGEEYASLLVNVSNANPNGQTSSINSAPVVIANDQSSFPVEQLIEWHTRNGRGFYASTDQYTPTATNNALSLFNPANSGKTALVFSQLTRYDTAGDALHARITNADPAFANAMTAANFLKGNLNAGSATASVVNVTYATASTAAPAISAASLSYLITSTISNSPFDLFNDVNNVLVLPPGFGFAVYYANAASGNLGFNIRWIEY